MLFSHHEPMMPYAQRPSSLLVDRRYKPGAEVAPNCPRCDSPNTKFCYYNNYSLSQPRYFCKGCRRYWTKGGSLRNVPFGGGCRKNRRGKSSMRLAAGSVAGGRDAAFGNRFPDPVVRPDMVLEGTVGNPTNQGQAMPDVPSSGDGSGIDLAMLYAKFLNHPPVDDGGIGAVMLESAWQMDEAFDTFSASSALSPAVLVPGAQLDSCHDGGFGEWSRPVSSTDPSSTTATTTTMLCSDVSVQAALGELSFAMDQSCFDSLGLPADDVANLSSWCSTVPNLSTLEDTKYDSLDSFPHDALSLHEGMMITGPDHDWSVDCQGLEALYLP
jgi:hypothetical protein